MYIWHSIADYAIQLKKVLAKWRIFVVCMCGV